MIDLKTAGTHSRGNRRVKRMGYDAMQLAGPGVFGPPRDRSAALAVLRAAVEAGVDHIDTSAAGAQPPMSKSKYLSFSFL